MIKSIAKNIFFFGFFSFLILGFVPVSYGAIPQVYLNEQKTVLDNPPMIEDGFTLIPLRSIFEQLGATVEWDGDTQTISCSKDDLTITLRVDDPVARIETRAFDKEQLLDVAPRIINDHTMVPLRFLSEAMGCKVEWDAPTSSIFISYNNSYSNSYDDSNPTHEYENENNNNDSYLNEKELFTENSENNTSSYTKEQIEWALAINAIEAKMNGKNYSIIGGEPKNNNSKISAQTILEQEWSIKSKEDVVRTINWLKKQGYSNDFSSIVDTMTELMSNEQDMEKFYREMDLNEDVRKGIEEIFTNKDYYQTHSIKAFDYALIIDIIGKSYLADYLDRETAEKYMIETAKDVQTQFDSWGEFVQNYVLGKTITDESNETSLIIETIDDIIQDLDNPWAKYPWEAF